MHRILSILLDIFDIVKLYSTAMPTSTSLWRHILDIANCNIVEPFHIVGYLSSLLISSSFFSCFSSPGLLLRYKKEIFFSSNYVPSFPSPGLACQLHVVQSDTFLIDHTAQISIVDKVDCMHGMDIVRTQNNTPPISGDGGCQAHVMSNSCLREVVKESKWKFKLVFAIRRRPPLAPPP